MNDCSGSDPLAPAASQFPDLYLIAYRNTAAALRANPEIKQRYLAL